MDGEGGVGWMIDLGVPPLRIRTRVRLAVFRYRTMNKRLIFLAFLGLLNSRFYGKIPIYK